MLVDYAEVFQVGNSVDLFGFFPFLSSSLPRGTQTTTKKTRHESSEAPTTGYEIFISAIATTGETEEPQRFSLPSASSPSSTNPFHDAASSFSSASHHHLSSSPSVVSLFVPSTMVVVGTTTGDLIGFQRYPYSSSSSCVPSSVSRIELMFFVHRYHYGPIYDIAVEPRSVRLATAGHDAVCRLTSWNTLVRWYACGERMKSKKRSAVHHKGSALARPMHEDGEGESRTHGGVPTTSTPSESVHGFHAYTWSSSSRVSSREPETLSVCGRRKGKSKGVGSSLEWNSTVAAVFAAMSKPPGVVVLSGHSLPVVKAQFTMDGRHVFSLSVDGHLREHALHGIVVEGFGIEGACGGSAGGELSSVSSLSSSSSFLSRLGSASTISGGCSEQAISSRDFFCTRVRSASPPSTSRTSRRVLMSTFVLSPDETFAVVAGEGIEWIDLRFLREAGPSYYVGEKEEEDSHFSSSFLHESEMVGKEENEWKMRDALPSRNGADNDNEEHETRDEQQGRMLLLPPQQRTWWSCIESHGGGASLSLSHSLSPSSPSPDPLASASEDFLFSSLHITSLRWLPWNSCAASLSVSTGSHRRFPLSGCITYRLAGTVVGRRERRSWKPQAKKDAANAEEEREEEAAPSTSPSAAVGHDGEVASPQHTRESGASREEHQEDALPTTTPSSVVLGELIWAEKPGCGIPTTRRRGGGENDGAAAPSWFSPHRISGSCLHPPALMEDEGEKVEEKEEKTLSPPSSSFSPCWWMHELNDHRATASLWREKNIYPCAAAFPFPSSSSLIPTSLSSTLQHTLRRRGILSTRGEVLEHLRCRKRQLHETCNFLFKKLKEEVAAEKCSQK